MTRKGVKDYLISLIDSLIERDTPMKPKYIIKIYDIEEAHCSICNSILDIPQLIKVNFCPKCGQRLDWSE